MYGGFELSCWATMSLHLLWLQLLLLPLPPRGSVAAALLVDSFVAWLACQGEEVAREKSTAVVCACVCGAAAACL